VAFRFPLASVLRVRESVERSEELALQRAELEVARAQRRLEELTAELDRCVAERDRALEQPTPAYRVCELQQEMSSLIDARQDAVDALEMLLQLRDDQRKRYQVAHNGRRMLTEMRAQQKDAYEQEQVRAQQKRLDDIFASRRQRV
jgi:flagellar export protein FliJ